MGATAIRGKSAFEGIMKVVIIYDDFASAAKAKTNLERSAQRAGETTRGNVELRRLDTLKQSATAAEVLREAADAHLIVIALSQTGSLPAWLLAWLESWAARRQVRDAALAMVGGGNGNALSMPVARELSRFADRHGLSFIFDAAEEPKTNLPFLHAVGTAAGRVRHRQCRTCWTNQSMNRIGIGASTNKACDQQ